MAELTEEDKEIRDFIWKGGTLEGKSLPELQTKQAEKDATYEQRRQAKFAERAARAQTSESPAPELPVNASTSVQTAKPEVSSLPQGSTPPKTTQGAKGDTSAPSLTPNTPNKDSE